VGERNGGTGVALGGWRGVAGWRKWGGCAGGGGEGEVNKEKGGGWLVMKG